MSMFHMESIQPNLDSHLSDLKWDLISEKIKGNRILRFHTFFALSLSIFSFMGWAILNILIPNWPWFIYVWGISMLSVGLHFTILNGKKWIQYHLLVYVIGNQLLFLSWCFSRPSKTTSIWFMYPLITWTGALAIHFLSQIIQLPIQEDKSEGGIKISRKFPSLLHYHAIIFFTINSLCCFTYMDTTRGYPWPVYVILVTGLFLVLHWAWKQPLKKNEDPWWLVHLVFFLDISSILFFAWALSKTRNLFWLLPILIWACLLAFHHWRMTKKMIDAEKMEAAQVTQEEFISDPNKPTPQLPIQQQ